MKNISSQDEAKFTNVIISVASSVVEQTAGVAPVSGAVKRRMGVQRKKYGNIHVYFKEDKSIVIDLFVYVNFGCSVPAVISEMQERIRKEVELATRFEVDSVNVNVSDVIFD